MNVKLKSLLVDDEPGGRNLLRTLLTNYCPDVDVIGEAGNIQDALQLIATTSPDLLFLDIEMPGGNGFDLLDQLQTIVPRIIFTTAYDQYAIKAFRYSAMDYLLKPINVKELKESVSRAVVALANQDHINKESDKAIAFPTMNGYEMVQPDQIVHCQADGSYTRVHLLNKSFLMISKSLKDIEALLGSLSFYRIHHAHLVNLEMISQYLRGKGGQVKMCDGTVLNVSVRRKAEFVKRLRAV